MNDEQLVQQFQLVEDRFNDALATNNVDQIERHLSNDWVLIEPQFGIVERDRFLSVVKKGDLVHVSMKKRVWRVKCYNDIAIVTSRGMNTGLYKNEPFHSEIWVTNIYKQVNENWLCIMSTEAPVSCV